jgi:hypothetical protein
MSKSLLTSLSKSEAFACAFFAAIVKMGCFPTHASGLRLVSGFRCFNPLPRIGCYPTIEVFREKLEEIIVSIPCFYFLVAVGSDDSNSTNVLKMSTVIQNI